MPGSHEARIPDANRGQRLDQALAVLFPEFSRTRLKNWIQAGRVLVNGRALRPKDLVSGGELVEVRPVDEPVVDVAPEPIALNVVHEDPSVFVIDKPAGLVVHPGAGNPRATLQNALLHRDPALAHLPRAGIVHRIDKETSGLLVVARTAAAHMCLTKALAKHEVGRVYEAVANGVMTAGGTIDAPIDRHPVDRLRMAVRGDGRAAVTHYRVIERFRAHTHVRVELETGRTHQIRVHLAHAGFALLGDPLYGRRVVIPRRPADGLEALLRGFRRQALHAARLAFDHPDGSGRVEFVAPLPPDLATLIAALRSDVRLDRADPRART